ncbi:MarR family winged helix-turn-helix transcriptional regulator [Ideonella sp.]|uniref:MarR family winged helix-turn-helix transcriptional regulator n=1 Tax=Ideonella sp. TaxID=1929293 RepID=UPI0035B20C03
MNPAPSRPRLVFLLTSAQRRLQAWIAAEQARAARQLGAAPSAAQGGVLFLLAEQDGRTMGELADALDLAPSALTGLVQRMETAGWVERRVCERDTRAQRVWLRDAGRAALRPLGQAARRIQQRLAEGFTDDELQTVARWLRHVQQLGDPPVE